MTVTERYNAPIASVDYELHNKSVDVPFEASLPEGDPIHRALAEAGVVGRPIAELQAGHQGFAIIDASQSFQPKTGLYAPFGDIQSVKEGSPTTFELDTEAPFVLVHFDESGRLVGQGIRQNSAMVIGREARDVKNRQFAYKNDEYLSREHFSIVVPKGSHAISITDRDSTNGTHLRYAEGVQTTVSGTEYMGPTYLPEQPQVQQPSEARITKEIVAIPEFLPTQEITCEDQKFHLSDVITSGGRDKAILYAHIQENGADTVVPRLLYKSNSDGGWRVAYGIDSRGRYVKEAHEDGFAHYTQETKLNPLIVDALEKAGTRHDPTHALDMHINRLFSDTNPDLARVTTADKEIFYYKSRHDKLMGPFRAVSAGYLDKESLEKQLAPAGYQSFGEYFKALDSTFKSLPGFVPDFKQRAIRTAYREHTLLGKTVIEDFPASFMGEPVVWSVGRDAHGRVWIDNIRPADAQTSTYGNYKTIFDAGLITNKPIEYAQQADALVEGKEAKDFNGKYVDITPLLSQLLPVRQYKKARGIA